MELHTVISLVACEPDRVLQCTGMELYTVISLVACEPDKSPWNGCDLCTQVGLHSNGLGMKTLFGMQISHPNPFCPIRSSYFMSIHKICILQLCGEVPKGKKGDPPPPPPPLTSISLPCCAIL